MKLNLLFNQNKSESIMYFSNEVILHLHSPDHLEALLINKQKKQENLDYCYSSIEDIDNYEQDPNEKEQYFKTIELINKAIDKSFTLNDFNIIYIEFDKETDITKYKSFLERISGQITINANNLSRDNIMALKNISFNIEPNIEYELNTKMVNLTEFIESIEIISTIESSIKRYSLSKLEQLILLYDLIKIRIFKYGDEKDYSQSRDLNRVLKEEEIVCAGYANIFSAVANHLDIPTFIKKYASTTNNTGHATNVSYFYDSYYDEEFTLEFDATWDSRKSIEDKKWINNYNYFGQSERLATLYKDKKGYKPFTGYYLELEEVYQRYLYITKHINDPSITNGSVKRLINLIIELYTYYENEDKINTLNEFLNELDNNVQVNPEYIKKIYEEILTYHNKKIPLDIFLKALYKVRRIEHSINPDIYPLNYKIIEEITSNKYTLDKLLTKLLISKESINNLDVLNYIPSHINNKIDYDINMMKLLNKLRNIKEIKSEKKGLTNK